jgi:biopolymer transport protein ExbB/TolQ
MDLLVRSLSWIASGLQVPVAVFILYLLVRALLALGAFFGQWSDRQRYLRQGQGPLRSLPPAALPDWLAGPEAAALPTAAFRAAAATVAGAGASEAAAERAIVEYELEADRQLGLLKVMTRIGPLLGLMGTLIPLGPALVGLANGDISLLARKMEVAFATTVTGLVIGAVGFLLYQVRQRWFVDDLSMLEFIGKRAREAA